MEDDAFEEGVDQHSATSLTVGLREAVEEGNDYSICLFLRDYVFPTWIKTDRKDMLSDTSRERIEWMVLRWFRSSREELLEDFVVKDREERLGEIIASHARVYADKVRDHDSQEAALHRRYRANHLSWADYRDRVTELRSPYRADDLVRIPIRGANIEPVG